jgi:hypothetical protein
MTATLASGADARYGFYLLNMLGSVKTNSDVFDRIVVYDLGLTPFQRRLIDGVRGIEVRTVPPFVPHWREGRTWKTWIWTQLEAERLFWLDAGLTVLRPLDDPLAQVRERGYFAVSQSHPISDCIPVDWFERYGIDEAKARQTQIAAGIIGFEKRGRFYDEVIVPTYRDALAGMSRGYSTAEVSKLNVGLDETGEIVPRDCPLFRWDQSVLNANFAAALSDPVINDVYKYAGWQSPRDHPEQLIWSHRRRGDFRCLPRVPYGPRLWLFGKAWGLYFWARWWRLNHSWLFKPRTYLRKLRLAR